MGTVVPKERTPDPKTDLLERLKETYGDRLVMLEGQTSEDGQQLLLAVVDPDEVGPVDAFDQTSAGMAVRAIGRDTHEKMLELEAAGFLKFTSSTAEVLYQSTRPDPKQEQAKKRLAQSRALMESAEHKFRMATLLAGGGFAKEAAALVPDIAKDAVGALSNACEGSYADEQEPPATVCERLSASGHLPQALFTKSIWLCTDGDEADPEMTEPEFADGQNALNSVSEILVYASSIVVDALAHHHADP